MDAIKELYQIVMANGPLMVLVAVYVITGTGCVMLMAWDLRRYYRKRELASLRYWFRKVRELMPKGVTGTNDSHDLQAVSQACHDAVFALAAEQVISWKKEEYYQQLLSIAFGSETLEKRKTHREAMRNRVKKNIASIKQGPIKPLDGVRTPTAEPVKKLSYLSRKSVA